MSLSGNMKKVHFELVLALILMGFGVAMRLVPHAANFTPIGAIALFGSLYLPKRIAVALPFGMMVVSDALIGFYDARIMLAVYGSFFAAQLIGLWLRNHKNVFAIAGGTAVSSLLFFFITNAAVWAFGTMYSHTLLGLAQSYVNGLPFFKYTLAGDLFYVAWLVGGFELMRRITIWHQKQPAQVR